MNRKSKKFIRIRWRERKNIGVEEDEVHVPSRERVGTKRKANGAFTIICGDSVSLLMYQWTYSHLI